MKGCIDPTVKISKKLDLLLEYKLFATIGLIPDFENKIFVLEGYGAYMGNYNEKSLKKYLKKNFSDCVEEGYEIVEGPAAPNKDGSITGKGLYLLNYENYIEFNKQKVKTK